MHEIITIDIGGDKPDGLGALKYKDIPRLNDWIEKEIDGTAYMFEVVKVAHSSSGAGCDIYVRRLKETPSSVFDLCQSI